MTYYSITTASNENTQNPDAERVERRRPDGGGWTRPLGHRSHVRTPPRRLATTETERTPIDANETRQKKILPYPPRARSVFRLARARIARASTPLAPAALVPAGAAGGGVRARAPTGGARAASGALIARHDAKKNVKIRCVRSFARESSRARVNAATHRRRQSDEDSIDSVSRRVVSCTTSHDSRKSPPSTRVPRGADGRSRSVARGGTPPDRS